MYTAASIFQLVSLTWMLTIDCSAVDVYISSTNQTWENASQANDCSLAELQNGSLNISHTVPQAPGLAWVGEQICLNYSVWINMTGCFNVTVANTGSKEIPVDGHDDPFVYCLQQCDSQQVFLTSTQCYCGTDVTVTSTPLCQGMNCGNHNNRLCGFNANTTRNDTKCACGYQKTDITTNNLGNCMSTKFSSKDNFVNTVQNCDHNMSVLCTDNNNQHSYTPSEKTDWTGALQTCNLDKSIFIGVKNGSKATNINAPSVTFWVGMFRVELPRLACMAINITNHKLLTQNCSLKLKSLCINQTDTTTTAKGMEQTSTPVVTFQSTSTSLVTGYHSTPTATLTQTHSLSTEQTTESSSVTSSPSIITTQETTKCETTSSGFVDSNIHTAESSKEATTTTITVTIQGNPPGHAKQNSSSEFPTLAVGVGAGGAVAFILVFLMFIVFYRRRKHYRSNSSTRDSLKSFKGNPANTQPTSTTTVMNDNIHSNAMPESAGREEYDHLESYTNRNVKDSRSPAMTSKYNTYDHVGLTRSQTDGDGGAYDNFSRKNENEYFSGEDYDHIVRHTGMYDHMGPVKTAEESDYDCTGSGERLCGGMGRHGTSEGHDDHFTPKNRNASQDWSSNKANNANTKGGNGLTPDRPLNGQDEHYTGEQYDHLPSAFARKDTSNAHEGDYDHTFAVNGYDHIGNVNKGNARSVVQEDEYSHVTEL